jgi:SAM-dependent methyltransferase
VLGLDHSESNVAEMIAAGCEAELVDLEDPNALDVLEGRTFDQIVTLDVLEHLRFPGQLLTSLAKHLRPGGEFIISLPNVTHLDVRLALLKGTFPYADDGLLDRTHLRFFDWVGVEELIGSAGLNILERFEIRRDGSVGPDAAGIDEELVEALGSKGDALVQQWVVLGSPDVHDVAVSPTGRFMRDSIERDLIIENSSEYARELESKYRELEVDLGNEIRRLYEELTGEIRRLEDALTDALLLEREVAFQSELIARISEEADRLRARIAEVDASYLSLRGALDTERHRGNLLDIELNATRSRISYRLIDRLAREISRFPLLKKLLRIVLSPFITALRP